MQTRLKEKLINILEQKHCVVIKNVTFRSNKTCKIFKKNFASNTTDVKTLKEQLIAPEPTSYILKKALTNE